MAGPRGTAGPNLGYDKFVQEAGAFGPDGVGPFGVATRKLNGGGDPGEEQLGDVGRSGLVKKSPSTGERLGQTTGLLVAVTG